MSNTYHFIGIKGAGMSALALMLHQCEKFGRRQDPHCRECFPSR